MTMLTGSVPWTKRAVRVLHLAHEEARSAGSPVISVEHILLGLLREGHGMGAEILRAMQVDEGAIRHALGIPRPAQAASSPLATHLLVRWLRRRLRRSSSPLAWDALRLNEQAKRCIEEAAEAAQMLHVRFIGTEHVLFGLASVKESGGATGNILSSLSLDAHQVQEQVIRLYQRAHLPQ